MADILPRDLQPFPGGTVLPGTVVIIDDGAGVYKATVEQVAATGTPLATSAEVFAGASVQKYLNPERTVEAINTHSPVRSVNGETGVVIITKGDIGLGNVENIDLSAATGASNIGTASGQSVQEALDQIEPPPGGDSPTYTSVADGLSASSSGRDFTVDNGDGTATVWLNDGGVAVEQRTLATTAYLASATGAGAIGLTQGGTVQEAVQYVTPEMFGAVADGVTDDFIAISAAIAAASADGMGLQFNNRSYATSATIDLSSVAVTRANNATLLPSHDGIGVQIVSPAGVPLVGQQILGSLTVEWLIADWTKNRKGFYIQNSYNGVYNISAIRATVSLHMHGNLTGCVYNKINVGQFNSHNVGVMLTTETSLGWINANEFLGGRWYGAGDVTGSLYEVNAGHIFIDDSLYLINGNKFQNNSLEWVGDDFKLARMAGTNNELAPKYGELHGDDTWITDRGIANVMYLDGVPYVSIGYDPDGGPNQRVDASLATNPSIYARSGCQITQGQAKHFETVSATVPAIRAINRGTGPAIVGRNTASSANPSIVVQHLDGSNGVAIPASGTWLVNRNSSGTIDRRINWNNGINTAPVSGTWKVGDVARRNAASRANPVVADVCISAGTPGSWQASEWIVGRGTTAQRPVLAATDIGVMYLDVTLVAAGKPIWWTGAAWVDATGAAA